VKDPRTARPLLLSATVALGLGSRLARTGIGLVDKSLGDALYAVAAYLVLGLLLPRLSRPWLAVLALGYCAAVELFQLTGIPARYAHLAPVRWLLGTTFAWHDLAFYAVGVAGIALVEMLMEHRAGQS
jgi:hypothetical protein